MDQGRHLLLYDGVCGLCTRLVDFVIRRDHQRVFSFAAIQSDIGSQIMTSHGGDPKDLNTLGVVLNYQTDPVYSERGDAVVALLQALGGVWKIVVLSKVLPRKARDWLYDQVAVRRYRVFGELDNCRVPTFDARSRFIDSQPEPFTLEMTMIEFQLSDREGSPPEIGQVPPQLQFSDLGSDQIRRGLKEWAFTAFPNVREHNTLISVPSSRALWLDEGVPAAHTDAFMPPPNSREFCHLHEDGSFHAVVDVFIEDEVLKKQWGVRHMFYDRGVKEVLVYAPRDARELVVAKKIIVESYRYASGDTESNFGLA